MSAFSSQVRQEPRVAARWRVVSRERGRGMRYAIRDEYSPRFGRQELTLWSGAFASEYEGYALELPRHDGFMVTTHNGTKVRVACESPRTDDNYLIIDAAINAALNTD